MNNLPEDKDHILFAIGDWSYEDETFKQQVRKQQEEAKFKRKWKKQMKKDLIEFYRNTI